MLDFKPITIDIKNEYQKLAFCHQRSCLHTFQTMFIWGQAMYTVLDGFMVFLTKYGDKYTYLFPVGNGDIKHIIEILKNDAKERNIPFKLSGLNDDDAEVLNNLFPQKFLFSSNRDYEDYLYYADDLRMLPGKKFHAKRNHLNKFKKLYPDFLIEEINQNNVNKAWEFALKWYESRNDENIIYEQKALKCAFDNYASLGFEGMLLTVNEQVIAFTVASQTTSDTFDVHFEKASKDYDGAYTAINYFFSNYLFDKYLFVKYINREEDLGIQGLRKAKLSYYPCKMIKRITATEIKNDN